MIRALPIALLFVVASAQAALETRALQIDTQASQAQFSVRTLWFSHLRGRFALAGEVRESADSAMVDAWIEADSLVMDDPGAQAEARGPDFFDVAKYPRIHFLSAPFAPALLAAGGTLQGRLELHGKMHPVQFTILPSTCTRAPLTCAIEARGTLSRGDYGMRARRGLIGDRVELGLRIVLRAHD